MATREDATQNTPGAPGARFIDFDAVLPNIVTIQRNGQRLDLRDDIPMEDVIRVFTLLQRQDEMREATTRNATDEFMAAFEDVRQMTLERCAIFVRHSYPEMTNEDVAAWLTMEQQLQVVMLFFQARLPRSSAPPQPPAADSANTRTPKRTRTGQSATSAASRPALSAGRSPAMASRQSPGRAGATSRRK